MLQSVARYWRIGRGRPVDRQVLIESGAVSDPIDVLKIEDKLLRVALPRFIKRVGKSLPQYTEEDE